MSAKSIVTVVVIAIFIGVLYVVFEKNFTGGTALSNSKSTSSQELSKEKNIAQMSQQKNSIINLPSPAPAGEPVNESTDLLKAAEGLEMRDYSSYFEELKSSVSK